MAKKGKKTAKKQPDDFTRDSKPVANIGKRFYTWATLGTFAGASFLVSSLWQVVQNIGVPDGKEKWVPLILSAIVVGAFAFATEPAQKTAVHQKAQKGLIAVANTLLVFFTVVGGNALVSG